MPISDNLKQQQAIKRQESITKVQETINQLKEMGYGNITISLLCKETGLSRSTLNKDYIQQVLKANKVGKFSEIDEEAQQLDENDKLQLELCKAKIEAEKYKKKYKEAKSEAKANYIEAMQAKTELQRTTGAFQALYEKIIALGIKIEI